MPLAFELRFGVAVAGGLAPFSGAEVASVQAACSEGCRAMRAAPWLWAARAVRRHRGCECQGGSSTPDGKIRVLCMIRGVRAAKRAPPWQDMRAVHSRKAICRAFRIHGARILPRPAHFGCMAAIYCQGRALFPSEAPSGMHEAKNLLRQGVRERIGAIYCHGRPPRNIPRRNLTAAGRWGAIRAYLVTASRQRTHFASILPSPNGRERIANTRCRGTGLRGMHCTCAPPHCLLARGGALVRAARRSAGWDRAFRLLGV